MTVKKRIKDINKAKLASAVLLAPILGLALLGLTVGSPITVAIAFESNVLEALSSAGLIIMTTALWGSIITYPIMLVFGLPMMIILETNKALSGGKKYLSYSLAGSVPGLIAYMISNFGNLPSALTVFMILSGVVIALISGFIMRKA